MVDTWDTCPRCGQQCYGQMSTGGFEPTPTHRCNSGGSTMTVSELRERLEASHRRGTYSWSEWTDLARDAVVHVERLEAENKRLREAHGAWVDGYDQAMHDADSVYIAQLDERDEEIRRLRGGDRELSDQKRGGLFDGTAIDYVRLRAEKHEKKYKDPKQAAHLRRLAQDVEDAIARRDEEIARLRKRLAEWVERLRWADGLTDVVEQMEGESRAALADVEEDK